MDKIGGGLLWPGRGGVVGLTTGSPGSPSSTPREHPEPMAGGEEGRRTKNRQARAASVGMPGALTGQLGAPGRRPLEARAGRCCRA